MLSAPPSGRQWWIVLALLVLAVCGARYATLLPVHGWSDDGSVYIQHAENLLQGQPYNHVLFAQTPSNKSPVSLYPPMLPVVLAAEIPFTGVDFRAFKITMLIIYGLALFAAGAALRNLVGDIVALATVLLLAVSFELGRLTDHINSDFLLLFLLCLLVLWEEHRFPQQWAQLVSALLVLAIFETRTAGIVVLPALVVYRLWAGTQSRRNTAVAALLSCVFLGISVALNRGGGNYFGQLVAGISPMTIRRNLIQYSLCLGDVFNGGRPIALLLDALAIYGAYQLLRAGKRSLWFVFLALYLPLMILWPFSDPVRFALPFLPLAIALAVYGAVQRLTLLTGPRLRLATAAVVTVILAAIQVRAYAGGAEADYESGINHPRTLELYKAIEADLPRSAVIVCRKARTVALMTGFHTIAYPQLKGNEFVTDLCQVGATHVISAPSVFEDDAKYLEPVIRENSSRMQVVFHNSQYTLYRWPVEVCQAK